MKIQLVFVLLLVTLSSFLKAQNHLDPVEKALLKLYGTTYSLDTAGQTYAKQIDSLNTSFRRMLEEERNQSILRGKINLQLLGDNAGSGSLYKIISGASFNKGTYPAEVEFSSNFDVAVENGEFRENLSEVGISYEHNYQFGLENYVFLNRYSDKFMSIDQRYESGIGFVLSGYSATPSIVDKDFSKIDSRLTKKGAEQIKKLFHIQDVDSLEKFAWHNSIVKSKDQAEKKVLKKGYKHTQNAILKEYYKYRIGVLFGIFAEIEKSSLKADFITGEGTMSRDLSLPGKQIWRWEVRPHFDFQGNDFWSLKIRPYFIFPLFDAREKIISQSDLLGHKLDYRIDWQTNLEFNIREDLFHNVDFGLSLQYRLLYDNVPPFADIEGPDDQIRFTMARMVHHIVRLTLKLEFK